MTSADRRIQAVASAQMGAFDRDQAHAAGLTDHQLTTRIRHGTLERIGSNAFRLPGTGSIPRAALFGLMLDVGAPCWAAGPTAAALHGFDGFDLAPPFHVVIPRGRNVRRAGSVIHTSEHLPQLDCAEANGIRLIRPTRTLVDLARMVDRAALTRAYDSAIRDGRTSEEAVLRRLARLEGRGHGRLGTESLLAVVEGREVTSGAHSFLEREFLRLLAERGMPRPEAQQVLGRAGDRLVRVDFRFPGTKLVVEVLGYRYHRTPSQLDRDAARMNDLIARGFLPYQFTYRQIMETPSEVMDTLERVLRQAA